MRRDEINKFIEDLKKTSDRTLVIIDFGNVEKWEASLGWKIGIRQLGNLVKHFSRGQHFLRRFYYGSDYGRHEKSEALSGWSSMVLDRARMNGFEIITKRVKYIPDPNNRRGFSKKCNFDIEMAVDMIQERTNYDTLVLFSGDGDFAYALKYLHDKLSKRCFIFGARDHVGKELIDAQRGGVIETIFFAEDFNYRLDLARFRP